LARTKFPNITTTSEWLAATTATNGLIDGRTAAGKTALNLLSDFRLISLENVERETKKAIGVTGTRWNSCGNPKPAVVWFPKSQTRELNNDHWINCASRMFLVPTWLINAKKAEGYELA
jgi:hypothetical protein